MAFNKDGLFRFGQGGYVAAMEPRPRRSLWSYATTDAASAVEASNYFPAKIGGAEGFWCGDTIEVVSTIDATPVLKRYVVTAVAPAGCTIVKQTV